ncbi:MAG: HAD family hydrolase [Proteobacteria bacterium]|nr:HAD family hydrolase [Pseudomonadota bacterium]
MTFDRQFDIILFDLEGTLVDFQWRLKDAVNQTLKILATAGIDLSVYGTTPGYAGLYNTTRDITGKWEATDAARLFDQIDDIYDTYDLDALSRWTPYPVTHQLLSRLSNFGYRMGVVSNCGAHAVDTVLDRFNLSGFFEVVLSRNDVDYLKPHPQGLMLTQEKFDAALDRTLFVGDSLNDILAAEKVSMPSCFLFCGESRVTKESADMATFQISSLSKLADFLIKQRNDQTS